MATSIRALKFLIGLFATFSAAPTGAQTERLPGSARSEAVGVATFIALLRQDAALRARFAQEPLAVLRDQGIDLAAFELPERLNEAQLARLLDDWSRWPAGQHLAQVAPEPREGPSAPAPVYGPPAD